jgi:hypothetical protein
MRYVSLFVVCVLLAGCASVLDSPRSLLGVSTRDLELRRSHAVYKTLSCSATDAFDAAEAFAMANKYLVFRKDRAGLFLVLMHIPGAVDTTEVGVFLVPLDEGRSVRIEVSSRSSFARRVVAQTLFADFADDCQVR